MNAHKLAATLPAENWEAISVTMTEWNSEADELAYRNL